MSSPFLSNSPSVDARRHAASLPNARIGTLVIAVLVLLLGACSGGSPELALDQETVDLGQVVNGEVRELEIPVQNIGSAPLVIEAVSTSCGCTRASIEPTTLGPGGSGVLRVEFDSGAHGPEENGPVMRQVFIASNDPRQPEFEFRLTADVVPDSG